ncbi:MAG: tetratricopeptide repeat protein [Spirochaetales bacterium]|nr:tetratricopeptide repeat protein [Spirochaetales bacterium]
MKKCLILSFLFSFTLLNAKINFYDNDINKIKNDLSSKTTMQKLLLIDNYINKNPKLADLYLYKAQLEFSTKDFIGVEKTLLPQFENNLFSDNQWKEAAYLLGISFYHERKLQKAQEIFEEIAEKYSDDSTAAFFLGLISQPAKSVTMQNNISGIDIEYINTLNRDYSTENQEEIGNYLYLLYKKNVSIIENNLFDYVQEGAIKVNNLDETNILESFPIAYDSKHFKAVSTEALLINPNGSISKIENQNIEFQNLPDSSKKNIIIKCSDIQKGTILCYKLAFKGIKNKKEESPNVSDIFYVASGIQTYKKNYTVSFPSELKFYLIPDGVNDFLPEETTDNGITTFSYTCTNPEILQLSQLENICIFDVSPKIVLTSYNEWNDFGKWFAPRYNSFAKSPLPENSPILVDLPDDKLEQLKNIYRYIQKNISNQGESTFLPLQTPEITLKNNSGNIADKNALLSGALSKVGIKSYPMMISSINNGQIDVEMPAPCAFNHMITYVPAQNGIPQTLYLDPSTKFTAYDNLTFQLQSTNALIIDDEGKAEVVSTPIIDATLNSMTEDYKVIIDHIGGAKVNLVQEITGSFAEYFRTQLAEKNSDAQSIKEDYFYRIQKDIFPNLKPEQMTLKEDNPYSGNFYLTIDTTADNVTEILLDGKQILNFQLGDLGEWFSMPPETLYDYRKDFAFTFKKKMDCQFPDNYQIAEHNLQNVFKENKYFLFKFNAEKIADNHFILDSELQLRNTIIPASEISYLNQYIGLLLQSFQFKIVMENPNINYETFFEPLLDKYKQPDVYKNYLSRLFAVKKMDKAEQIAVTAKQLFPTDNYFSLVLAMVKYELEKFDECKEELLYLLEKTPDDVIVYEYLAQLYRQTEDDENHLEILLKAHEKFPKEISFVNSLVEFYRKNDQLDTAINLLKETLKNDENNSNIYADLGYLYSLAKDFENAKSNLQRAIELNDNNSYALNNLAWLYCENHIQLEDAVAFAQKACELEPNNDNFLDTLAEAYYQTNQYEKAIEIIKKAIDINPNYDYLHEQLEKIKKAAGQNTATDDSDNGKVNTERGTSDGE